MSQYVNSSAHGAVARLRDLNFPRNTMSQILDRRKAHLEFSGSNYFSDGARDPQRFNADRGLRMSIRHSSFVMWSAVSRSAHHRVDTTTTTWALLLPHLALRSTDIDLSLIHSHYEINHASLALCLVFVVPREGAKSCVGPSALFRWDGIRRGPPCSAVGTCGPRSRRIGSGVLSTRFGDGQQSRRQRLAFSSSSRVGATKIERPDWPFERLVLQ